MAKLKKEAAPAPCPECGKKVLKVEELPSTRIYVHEVGGTKERPCVFGCAVSNVRTRR